MERTENGRGLPKRLAEMLERFGSFMADTGCYAGSPVALLGVPMDYTVSARPGSRFGPAKIREVSYLLEEYSPELDLDLSMGVFCDLGDLSLPFGNVRRSLELAEEAAGFLFADGKVPCVMGGDHLVTYPLVRAASVKYPDLAVVQFDAHADLREGYAGEELSHATVMRRVIELVGPKSLYQLGIRSGTADEFSFARANTYLRTCPRPGEAAREASTVVDALKGRPVYVTLDIDVVDPAFAPGTGTPEPGGWSSADLLEAIRVICRANVVGFDVVEVLPAYDHSDRTALLAAKVLREVMLSVGARRMS